MNAQSGPSEGEIPSQVVYSIGEIAERTGITTDTLRLWERRYGRPVPVRLASGHRRFTQEQLDWLRRVAEGLALGLRAGQVVSAPADELDRLLIAMRPPKRESPRIQALLRCVSSFDDEGLRGSLLADWRERGPEAFLQEVAGPLLDEIGAAWSDGRIDVRHEHVASEVITDVLRALRGGLPRSDDGPLVLLATLRHEQHGLGLLMGALSASLAGARARILGVDTPNDEITHAAREIGAEAVAISVSLASGGVETDRVLADLRRSLPAGVALVVGGRGARGSRRKLRGIHYVESFDDFGRWLKEHARERASKADLDHTGDRQ